MCRTKTVDGYEVVRELCDAAAVGIYEVFWDVRAELVNVCSQKGYKEARKKRDASCAVEHVKDEVIVKTYRVALSNIFELLAVLVFGELTSGRYHLDGG